MDKDFEVAMEKQIETSFDEAELLIEKLPNVEKIRSQVWDRMEKIRLELHKYVIKMPVSIKVDKDRDVCLVYQMIKVDSFSKRFAIRVKYCKGGLARLFEVEDDELFLKCAMATPDLIRKVRNEAHRLKRELCKEIDSEIGPTEE